MLSKLKNFNQELWEDLGICLTKLVKIWNSMNHFLSIIFLIHQYGNMIVYDELRVVLQELGCPSSSFCPEQTWDPKANLKIVNWTNQTFYNTTINEPNNKMNSAGTAMVQTAETWTVQPLHISKK